MPFEIIRNDITNIRVDAIVNTANPRPVIGSGVDAAVHAKAGPMLLAARKIIGTMNTGEACITPGFKLPAKHIIHTVGPVWEDGGHGEAYLLRQCYEQSLKLAWRHRLKSIAFPLISTGNYGFPKRLALQIATEVIKEFLTDHDMQIYLVVFSKDSFELSSELTGNVRSFIDECYAQEKSKAEYSFSVRREYEDIWPAFEKLEQTEGQKERKGSEEENRRAGEMPSAPLLMDDALTLPSPMVFPGACEPAPYIDDAIRSSGEDGNDLEDTIWSEPIEPKSTRKPQGEQINCGAAPAGTRKMAKKSASSAAFDADELTQMVKAMDKGFSETLLRLIDESGQKDSDIYKKANVDRKLFSKIRNNPQYKPSKATAVAFAIALELDLEETRDFIGRAGYALSRSNTFDIIIEYFITHGHYDIYEINMMLFEFDQSLLGA